VPNNRSTIRAPILPKDLEAAIISELDDVDIDRCRLERCACSGRRGERVRFDAVHAVGAELEETRLTDVRWLDVLCERCNLSMIDWPKAVLTRVELRGCRVSGATLLEGQFEDVRFVDCQLDFATFSGARFQRVAFERCRLKEAAFIGADLGGVAFVGCEMHGVDLTNAKLQGADVRSSLLNEVRVGPTDVRGLIVNKEQASVLAKLFGLVVRDADG